MTSIAQPVVEVVLDVSSGSTALLPDDASANANVVVMTAGRSPVPGSSGLEAAPAF